MKKIAVFCFLLVTIIACSKNKFKTQPQVQITSFGPSVANVGQTITLKAKVTDKEGDLQDSVLLVKKLYNITTSSLLSSDTIRFSLKNFGSPIQSEIELQCVINYGQLVDGTIYIGQESADRNLSIGIIVFDNAGNKSDYVETNKIVLKKS
ncbi:MAG TPA: hypothetical protein VGO09_10380 [Flavisolibacter sp.]|jgi:hypothetical protein|nr:hypothetical protein [Flavisolibacter sp.]